MISIQKIILLGFGNIGQALLPLLRAKYPRKGIVVFDQTLCSKRQTIAQQYGAHLRQGHITQGNYRDMLNSVVAQHDLVVNVATSICSLDVLAWVQQQQAFYLDTCIDPWCYQDGNAADASNTNYQMRAAMMALRARQSPHLDWPTAVVAHGANPGLVSLLVKQGLMMLASQFAPVDATPACASEWAQLAQRLGVRVIQISERDTQASPADDAEGAFVNTWSVDGFVAEALQPAELGWGTHEHGGPLAHLAQQHDHGDQAAVYFKQLGAHVQVRSWSPNAGEFVGYLISHNESNSLASFLTVMQDGHVAYRPTVYFAYHPCDQTMQCMHLLGAGNRQSIKTKRVLKEELTEGMDELGVLIISDEHPSLWLGSQLSVERARSIAPHNNATSLQVVGSMMAAIDWVENNPYKGIVESEDMDHEFILQRALPYWAPIVHEYRAWPETGSKRQLQMHEFWVNNNLL